MKGKNFKCTDEKNEQISIRNNVLSANQGN